MQPLPNRKASETADLWQAVGGQPLGGAMAEMGTRGWTYVAAIPGELPGVLMKRGVKRASVYAPRGNVGMISLIEADASRGR